MADANAKCEVSEIESNGSSVTIEGTPLAKENEMYDSDEERAKNRELFTAIRKGDLNMVKSLLRGGVNINIVDKNNKDNTPLHYAVERKRNEIVEELLNPRWKADITYVDARNNGRENAMDIAKRLNCQDIVKILESFEPNQQVSVVAQPAIQQQLLGNLNCESYDGQEYNAQSSNQLGKPKNGPEKQFSSSKRPGTTGGLDGHLYEIDLIILGKLRGDMYTDKFFLTSNKDGVGAFDDVVIRYWKKNSKMKPITIFAQLKRVKSKITTEKFENPKSDNGNFYLPKYLESYLDIRDKFDGKSDDPIFVGNFRELDVRFVIYTNASLDEKFDKDRIKLIKEIDSNIFSTKNKAFKINALEVKNSELIKTLEDVCLQKRITSLAKAFVTYILCDRNYNNMMTSEIMSTYHVFLSKIVVNVETERLKGDKGVEYREGKINDIFLEKENEDLLKEKLRKEILCEYTKKVIFSKKANAKFGDNVKKNDLDQLAESLKPSGIVDYNIIRKLCGSVIKLDKDGRKLIFADPKELKNEDAINFMKNLKKEIDASYKFDISYELIKQELKERFKEEPLKLNADFGNIDFKIKKPQHFIKQLIKLFKHKSQNVISIDDSMVGHGKILTNGDLKNIGKLVGSLLIFDQKKKMLKFDNSSQSFREFFEKLKTTAKSDDLNIDDYEFDIKVKNFPRDSLVVEERDRANVEEFLSKLEFFVEQTSDEGLKEIIKNEMTDLFKLTREEAEDSFLRIRNRAEKFWRSELDYLEKDDDFFTDIVKYNIIFDVKQHIALFTGRDSERTELHDALKLNNSVVLAGLGGIGKSELVKKYVSEHSDDYHGNIIWINAQNYEDRVKSFERLAQERLGINVQNSENKQKNIKSTIEEVYGFFAKRKSLFIFDNSEKLGMPDERDGIYDFLPSSTSNENKTFVIITSRNQKWEEHRKVISLGSFKSEEAMEFIRIALDIKDDSQEKLIQKLAKTLQYFPLALQQAVAYIKQSDEKRKSVNSNNRFMIDDYLQEYEKKAKDFLEFPFPEDSDNKYTKTTFTTWCTTIDKIKMDKECGEKALEILNIIAYCVPYNIPVKMFSKLEKDEGKLGAAVLLLKKFSMVNLEDGKLTVHRLVQQVTKINLADNEEDTLRKAFRLFDDGSNQIDLFNRNIGVSNVDHAMSIWSYTNEYKKLVKEFSSLPTLIVNQLRLNFRFEEAHSFGSNALELLKRILDENHISLLSIMEKVASVSYDLGRDDESLKIYQELTKKSDIINQGGNKHIFFEVNIGLLLIRLGKPDKALEIFEIFEIFEQLNGFIISGGKNEHNKGLALSALGRIDESLKMFWDALEKKEKCPNPPLSSILDTKNSISAVLEKQGRYGEALKLSWDVYKGRKEILGEKHPDTLNTYDNIAVFLKYQGKFKEALKISKIVDEELKKLLPNHPRTLKGMLNTAEILELQGNYDEALTKVKEIYERKKYSNDLDLNILELWMLLAQRFAEQGDYDKALKELNEVHEERKKLEIDRTNLDTDSAISGVSQAQSDGKKYFFSFVSKELHIASHEGRLEEVNFILLKKGVAVNGIAGENGVTALHLAAKNGHVNIVKALLNQGAEFNIRAIDPAVTPLNLATQSRHQDVVRILRVTQDLFSIIKDKNLSECDKVEKLKYLIENGAILGAVNDGFTTLWVATDSNFKQIVDCLLKHGADAIKITLIKGNTLLHIAAAKGYNEIVELLLKHVRETVDFDKSNKFVNTQTTIKGNAPLHVAAQRGFLIIVKSLLKYGAIYDIKNKEVKTPIDLSTNRDTINLLKLIKKLFEMAKKGDSELINGLKLVKMEEFEAIANARNNKSLTLVQLIKANGHTQLASQVDDLVLKLSQMNLRSHDVSVEPGVSGLEQKISQMKLQ